MRRSWLPALVLVLVALGLGLAARRVRLPWRGDARSNLLLVTIDTLRADHVGCYGYAAARTGRLDGLAARGLRFERAATVTPLTLPAHSSLMTGRFPGSHGVRDNGGFYLEDAQTTLAERLTRAGYRSGGFVSAFVLDARWGINQGFARFFDDFDLAKFDKAASMDAIQRPGSETVDVALRWLAEEGERPFFAWVHLYDPHAPYAPPEPFASQFPRTASGAYDGEIATADAQLGRLLDALESDGRLPRTLVAVLGDHGEMLGEHDEMTHGFFVYDPVVHIPLILAGPGVPQRVVKEQVRIVDVMPTLLALLGQPAPTDVQGVSLMPLARGERLDLLAWAESWYPRYHYGWADLAAIQDGRYKLIRAPRPELYDLERDPRELTNLASQEGARVQTMLAALDAHPGHAAGATAKAPAALDSETSERLEALGYIGGAVSARHLEERPRGDPKDKIGLYNLLKDAGGDSAQGHYDAAIAKAKRALALDPEVLEGHMLLGNFLRKAGQHQAAIEAYRQALRLDPEHQETLFALAVTYKDMGRVEDARLGFERARKLDPRNGRVLWQLADIDMRQKRFDRAEATLRDALAHKVEEDRFLLKLGECLIEAGRAGDAEPVLQQALARRPGLEGAHFNLGLAFEERGRLPEAIAAYEAELQSNPKGFRACFNLAKLLAKGGRSPEALARFRQTVEINPQFGTGHLYLAKALFDAGDLENAERTARAGLATHPDPDMAPLGHFVLADIFYRKGRQAEADREVAAARSLQQARPAASGKGDGS